MRHLVLVASLGLALAACSDASSGPAPTVVAHASLNLGPAPLAVAFTCDVTGGTAPVDVAWSFGDGGVAAGALAEHTYLAGGAFVARCTATDGNGRAASDPVDLVVDPPAVTQLAVAVGASPAAGPAPLAVALHASAAGATGEVTYAWALADGGAGSGATLAHTFTDPGVWTAVVTATDASGATGRGTVTVTVGPPAVVDPGNAAPVAAARVVAGACAVTGHTVVELDASASSDPEGEALSWRWELQRAPVGAAPALADATRANPSFVPDRDGTYALRAFVSDGATTVASAPLTVEASGPRAVTITSGDLTARYDAVAALPLVAVVDNACGAPVPDAWVGLFAEGGVTVDASPTPTDADGRITAQVRGGRRAGTFAIAAVVQTADGATARDASAVTVPPEAGVQLMLDVDHAFVAGEAGEHPIVVRVADRNGAPTQGPDMGFFIGMGQNGTDLALDLDGDGACELTGASAFGRTEGGEARIGVCAKRSGMAFVEVIDSDFTTPALHRWTVYQTDFERRDAPWTSDADRPVNAWTFGVPPGPAAAGFAGAVAGTFVDGPLSTPGEGGLEATSLHLGLTLPAEVFAGGFAGTLELRQRLSLGAPARCGPGHAAATLFVNGRALSPGGAPDALDPCTGGPGVSGDNGEVMALAVPVVFDDHALDLEWRVAYFDHTPVLGWAIDDLRVRVDGSYAALRVVAAAAVRAEAELLRPGSLGCGPALVAARFFDAHGNRVPRVRARVDLDAGAALTGLTGGQIVSGLGTCSAVVELDGDEAVLAVSDDAAGPVMVRVAHASVLGATAQVLAPVAACAADGGECAGEVCGCDGEHWGDGFTCAATWQPVATLPDHDLAGPYRTVKAAVLGGRLYFATEDQTSMWALDLATGTFLGPLANNAEQCGCGLTDVFFAAGGALWDLGNDGWKYDALADAWRDVPAWDAVARGEAAAAVDPATGLVYLGGGRYEEPNVLVFDPAGPSFADGGPLPFSGTFQGIFTLDGDLYVLGGLVGGSAPSTRLAVRRAGATTWDDLPSGPTDTAYSGRAGASGTFDRYLWVAGSGRLELFDTVTRQWRRPIDLPAGTISVAADGDVLYALAAAASDTVVYRFAP